jgi:DNA-binding transcriptional ArsR family regulator
LEANAKLVLTDSGGVQEETSILKVPCVTLRDNTERPETLEVGSNVLVGVNRTFILDCVKSLLSKERNWPNPFGDGKAGSRIVKLLMQPQTLDQLSEETQEVFRAIADLGTCSPTSLSKAIGKPPSTIQYHLNTLKQAGLFVTNGKPPTTRYYIKRDEDIGEIKNIST